MPPKAEKKNNGFDRLRADLKAQTPQNVYLFYGEETYLRSYYLEELHRLLIPAGFEEFNYHRLSGKGLTVQELAEVTEAMPMMAQHTMVVVTIWTSSGWMSSSARRWWPCWRTFRSTARWCWYTICCPISGTAR